MKRIITMFMAPQGSARKANKNEVGVCLLALIQANGKTTTLEIKQMLQNTGFFAKQSDVSTLVKEIFDEDQASPVASLCRQLINDTYYEYSLVDPNALPVHSTLQSKPSGASKSSNIRIPNQKVTAQPTHSVSMDVTKVHLETNDQKDWIVYKVNDWTHGDVFIYDKSETRDHVRCSFAKLTSIPFTSIRASRVKTFISKNL